MIGADCRLGGSPGELHGIHAVPMDSRGRLFVGDSANQRIQVIDDDGSWAATWKQPGSLNGIYLDPDDRIYVADSDARIYACVESEPALGCRDSMGEGHATLHV